MATPLSEDPRPSLRKVLPKKAVASRRSATVQDRGLSPQLFRANQIVLDWLKLRQHLRGASARRMIANCVPLKIISHSKAALVKP